MFEKEYKSVMDSITATPQVKSKILAKIDAAEQKYNRKNPAVPWRVGFAVVACVAVVLGVIFVPKGKIPLNNQSAVGAQTLSAAKNYNEIYKIFRDKKIIAKYSNGVDLFLGADEIVYETVEDGTSVGSGVATAPNENATPSTGSDANTSAGASKNEAVNGIADNNTNGDYSETTEQVEGVSEADIVKTDGKNIYYLSSKKISIFSAQKEQSQLLSQIDLGVENGSVYGEMFLKGDRLILLSTSYSYKSYTKTENYVSILIYDISDPKNPQKVTSSCQQGDYNTARMIGDYIYLVSNCYINVVDVEKDKPESYVPSVICNDVMTAVPADSIYRYGDTVDAPQYAVVGAYNYKDGALSDTASILGGANQIYCSTGNIILTKNDYRDINESNNTATDLTVVSRLEIKGGKIEYKSSGEIEGTLENQFFIDEHNGYFRFVTSVSKTEKQTLQFENTSSSIVVYRNVSSASLTILDSELKKVGEIKDLAPDERVYSVRFMGDIAYFVTFRQVDPLFSADLSDPKNPKIIGELKIPGFSEYMYPYGEGKLLGFGYDANESTGRTGDLKLSMFDITDPANVTENDKTVVSGYNYSTAISNHKAMLVSVDKNLIGFASPDSYGNLKYLIYKYEGNAFVRAASLDVADNYKSIDARGLFVKDGFYVVCDDILKVYDINNFLEIAKIDF